MALTWVRNFYGAFFVNFEFLTVRSSFVRKNRDTDIQIYRETDKTLNSVAKTSRKAQLRRASRQISVLQKCWRKKSFHTPIIGEYCKFSPMFYHDIKKKIWACFPWYDHLHIFRCNFCYEHRENNSLPTWFFESIVISTNSYIFTKVPEKCSLNRLILEYFEIQFDHRRRGLYYFNFNELSFSCTSS